MSIKSDAQTLRNLKFAGIAANQVEVLERIANQLESDAKRYEQSQALQDIGKSAFASIAEMVAALECDYDRLAELREERDRTEAIDWMQASELSELEEAAGECESREDAERRIQEDPLSLEVRTGWREMWSHGDNIAPEEFCILLGTGGPATRIRGELRDGEPYRAWLEAQDWGTPWAQYIGADQDTLLTYCRCFYFGEG